MNNTRQSDVATVVAILIGLIMFASGCISQNETMILGSVVVAGLITTIGLVLDEINGA